VAFGPAAVCSISVMSRIEAAITPDKEQKRLRTIQYIVWGSAAAALIVSVMAISQGPIQTLVVSGYPGSIPVTQMHGRNYVGVEALARVVDGSLVFNGNQMTLTLSAAGVNAATQPPAAAASPATSTGFSREFLQAGIEAMSSVREWHSALASAIQNQYPVREDGLAQYQAQAMSNLRLAQASATTDADQNAAQLLSNEYQKMKQLSDKYVAKRTNLTYIAPGALKSDALDQRIVACGKSLGAMVASGQFVDDGTCH
jgi:hypothetical protein